MSISKLIPHFAFVALNFFSGSSLWAQEIQVELHRPSAFGIQGGQKNLDFLPQVFLVLELDRLQTPPSRFESLRGSLLQRQSLRSTSVSAEDNANSWSLKIPDWSGRLFLWMGSLEAYFSSTPSEYLIDLGPKPRSNPLSFELSALQFDVDPKSRRTVYRIFRKDLIPPSNNRLSNIPRTALSADQPEDLSQHIYWQTVGRHIVESSEVSSGYEIAERRSRDKGNNYSLYTSIEFRDDLASQTTARWSESRWAWQYSNDQREKLWLLPSGDYIIEKRVQSDAEESEIYRAEFRAQLDPELWSPIVSVSEKNVVELDGPKIRWIESENTEWAIDPVTQLPLFDWQAEPQLFENKSEWLFD